MKLNLWTLMWWNTNGCVLYPKRNSACISLAVVKWNTHPCMEFPIVLKIMSHLGTSVCWPKRSSLINSNNATLSNVQGTVVKLPLWKEFVQKFIPFIMNVSRKFLIMSIKLSALIRTYWRVMVVSYRYLCAINYKILCSI